MKKAIGYLMFAISFMAWAAIAILPFVNVTIEMVAAITPGLVVGGEVAFLLSIALLGRAFLAKIKGFFIRAESFFQKKN